MDDIISKHKVDSIALCDKLIRELETNTADVDSFFGGELREAYVNANDSALDKIKSIRSRITNT